MIIEYQTMAQESTAEIVEKKSRFIAHVIPIRDEEDGFRALDEIRARYREANHNCWAFVTGIERKIERCSDDGEPSGTAGRPILEVIKGANLTNVLVVVTRYFGGTLLGTGGLVKAYTQASREGIVAGNILTKIYGLKLQVKVDYTFLGKVQYFLAQQKINIIASEYETDVKLVLKVAEKVKETLIKEIVELTNGQVEIEEGEREWF